MVNTIQDTAETDSEGTWSKTQIPNIMLGSHYPEGNMNLQTS